MDDKNGINPPEQQQTPEIPTNDPGRQPEPIRDSKNKSYEKTKHRQRMRGIKIAYAVALIFALGGTLVAKISTENALKGFEASFPTESEISTLTQTEAFTLYGTAEEPDFEVRNNLTDVPDTREETQAKTPDTTVSQTEEKTTENSPYAEPYSDYYTLPLGTDITNDYSPSTPVYNATMGDWRTHNGVDFKGSDGAQVVAISYGKVTAVYDDTLYGTVAQIDHGNGVTAKYCGLNKDVIEVKAGDTVKAGTVIGYLGEIPCEKTELSHLHFEITYNGENTDPLELMGK